MNLGGESCSEPRLRHCTLAWVTERDCVSNKQTNKQRKASGMLGLEAVSMVKLLIDEENQSILPQNIFLWHILRWLSESQQTEGTLQNCLL